MRRKRKNPAVATSVLVTVGVLGVGVAGLVALLRPKAPAPAAPLPAPAPELVVVQETALPLDVSGFPTQATRQFVQDNGLKERAFGPIEEETFAPRVAPTPVQVFTGSDTFTPGTPEGDNGGAHAEQEEEASLFDSFFS